MFFRRAFAKNHHDYGTAEMFEENSSDQQSPPPPPPVKMQKRRASIEEKQSRGLSVLQLTPLWEHIIRTNSMPRSVVLSDVFEEFFERLHDPEWQVRQHALRVLVDVLIVMGQGADYHIQNLVHPLVDNLGHIAPAVRKGALDALRVYVAQTAMPETVMLDIMTYGMDRPAKDPFSGRMTVAVMLALPALILPILITPKRAYVVKAVMDALSDKMVKITYQEIALKILLKIKEMVGPNEFAEHMPQNIKKDFDLLCKVYGLPKDSGYNDVNVDMHVPSQESKNPWASKFVPRKDIQGNVPSSHAPMHGSGLGGSLNGVSGHTNGISDGSKYFGSNYDSTYPFERTRLSNNLGTPKRQISPRLGSGGILRSSSENSLIVDFNGNSSESESGSIMSFQTKNNTAANSKTLIIESKSPCNGNAFSCEKSGKVIMETEIKINPETAVTMRILEQNASTQTDDSDEDNGSKRIITDFSAPYPVTPMRPKNPDENNNFRNYNFDSSMVKNGRRVRFGGEIVKMRTPDSDTVDQSDDNESDPNTLSPNTKMRKQTSFYSDENSSVSSDNSNSNEYIKQANMGFENTFRSNIDSLKEKKSETPRRNYDPPSFTRASPVDVRPSSARTTQTQSRPMSSRAPVVRSSSMNTQTQADSAVQTAGPSITIETQTVTSVSRPMTGNAQTQSVSRPMTGNAQTTTRTTTTTNTQTQSAMRPGSSSRGTVMHSPPLTLRIDKASESSSPATDFSQELTIGIPDVETVLPAHFTPPNIMIKKTTPQHGHYNPIRPATSPMLSPRIITVPLISSNHSSHHTSPVKSAPTTPNSCCSSKRTPERTFIRRSVSSLSPRAAHHSVTMLHNLQRSPLMSPRSRRGSVGSTDGFGKAEDGHCCTPGHEHFESKNCGNVEMTPASCKDSPAVTQPRFKSWEELGIVDYSYIKDLKSGVSFNCLLFIFAFKVHTMHFRFQTSNYRAVAIPSIDFSSAKK